MKKLTLKEKEFLIKYRPRVEIESITFAQGGYGHVGDGDLPDPETALVSELAGDVGTDNGDYEFVYADFTFVDKGADIEKKTLRFKGFAQFFDDEGDVDVCFDEAPDLIFSAVADKDGRFTVSVPMIIRPFSEDGVFAIDTMKSHEDAVYQFSSIEISNGFASEELIFVSGAFNDEECDVEDVEYRLADESKEKEV